ncbi:MAG TPA: DoxX family protein [Acidimicrobiales bacterium]|jgi:hypothetical protein
MASDGIEFVECDKCGLGHSMRTHETMKPREWAKAGGWVTHADGKDYCPDCRSKGFVGAVRNEQSAPSPSKGLVFGLAGSLLLSVLYDATPNRWFEEEFDHLRLPRWFRFLFIGAKSSAVAGLLMGLGSPKMGRLTARSLIAYFVLALGAQLRAGGRPIRYVPAASMLAWSALADRAFTAADEN